MRSVLPRVAAGTTGLLAGLAVQRILLHGWADATPWIIAAVVALLWWVAERRVVDAFDIGQLTGRLQGLTVPRGEADRG